MPFTTGVLIINYQLKMIQQTEFRLSAKRRGCHLVTREILDNLPRPLPKVGLLNLFVQHTSCALSINENADPDVRYDMEKIMNHIVKENEPYYDHVLEGSDDMPVFRSPFSTAVTVFQLVIRLLQLFWNHHLFQFTE